MRKKKRKEEELPYMSSLKCLGRRSSRFSGVLKQRGVAKAGLWELSQGSYSGVIRSWHAS